MWQSNLPELSHEITYGEGRVKTRLRTRHSLTLI